MEVAAEDPAASSRELEETIYVGDEVLEDQNVHLDRWQCPPMNDSDAHIHNLSNN